MLAVGVALLGVLGATGAYTSIRAIGKRAHALHAITSFSSQCVIASTVASVASVSLPLPACANPETLNRMIVTGEKFIIPTKVEWLSMLLMIGLFGFFAQILLTMGLQRETASRGSMAIYTQIVFATIFERIFFNTVPSPLSVIGTVLIIFSAIYTALSKKQVPKLSLNDESTTRLLRVSEGGNLEPYEDDVLHHEEDCPNDDKGVSDGGSRRMSREHREDDRDLVLPLFNETNDARSPSGQ
ncbi:hypothetical protein EST38_g5016 [Candolleomyces aberdarensis]|uniref:EamA domain-containing protein n=1 Tax=Candolleomyces aberdarensis TaxID=2316362 RepID=A0A4Q2DLJ3_9AGAR|nr:hypothetical protein EST38_g5016 [Candolleomyces aberdarensis]